MLDIKIKDCRDKETKYIGFITAEDTERKLYLHCKIFIYNDNTISLEKFLRGSVEKYNFKYFDMNKDTLFFKGSGRGRKPEWAEVAMRNFIGEVQREILGKTIEEISQ